MHTKSFTATFLVGFFLLTSPSYAQINIESQQLKKLDERTKALIIKSLPEEHANYRTCSFQAAEIDLKGLPSAENALFLTTTPNCWGAWQGPIWILQTLPNGTYKILAHTISYNMEAHENIHHGLNDLVFSAGSANESIKEVWAYNGETFEKVNTVLNDAFE